MSEPETLTETARASRLKIANMAVALLTKDLLDDLPESYEDADRTIERDVARLFDAEYDAVLAARPWAAARRIVRIVANAVDQPADDIGTGVYFRLPADLLRIVRLGGPGDQVAVRRYRRVGGYLVVTDVAEAGAIVLDYVARVAPDALETAPLLMSAIAARLAWRVVMFISHGEALQARLWDYYQAQLAEAWAAEVGQQGSTYAIRSPTLDAMSGYDGPRRGGRDWPR